MQQFFTHVVAVLYERVPDQETLRSCFSEETVGLRPPGGTAAAETNAIQGEGFSLIWNPATGERVEIDAQLTPWPDGHDGPQAASSPLGLLGPGASAGGLARAVSHGGRWTDAGTEVDRHAGFVRIALCGPMLEGAGIVNRSSPLERVRWMQEAARRLAGLPGAVAYFNPCAELVWSPALLAQGLD